MGQIVSGRVRVGQPVTILPSGRRTTVTGIVTFDGDLKSAFSPQSITLTLAEDLDIARGDMIVEDDDPPTPQTVMNAIVCWMSAKPLRAGKKYVLRHTTRRVKAMISGIDFRIDPNTLERSSAIEELKQNDIARVSIKTLQPIVCDPYRVNRETGAFILIDDSNDTVAAGFIESSGGGNP
jgi:sulfate adenylyltransferase subunit 1